MVEKVTISVMFPAALDSKIERLANTEERTKSHYIRRALEQYLAQYPEPTPAP
ncbi:ribbon-helix-helix domain-containing protein [Chroococcidiopsis sp. CCMEE 29]|uniref:ribbon-helix-helix domain-containing protein n=1 Tax=Chroococcidiopsis sp. CCMEE 29 TaxID=155894 RepID=UPI002020E383|nr:ribbon-helix-helix domain-containing protein [Chroococcidiopsis sp. CCMEE 29]